MMLFKDRNVFVPGARVAIQDGPHGDYTYREGSIAKVYKNGNFILDGDPGKQQWSPSHSNGARHSALKTGDNSSWHRGKLYLWTDEIDGEIRKAIALRALKDRWMNARRRFENINFEYLTPELMDAVEAALDLIPKEKARSGGG